MKVIKYDNPSFKEKWKLISGQLYSFSPLYSYQSMLYYQAYYRTLGFISNKSFIITTDENHSLLCPIFIFKINDSYEISLGGSPIKGPYLNFNYSRSFNNLLKKYNEVIHEIIDADNIKTIRYSLDPLSILSSEVLKHPLELAPKGYNTFTSSILDLRLGSENIWRGLRGSYKPLIKRAQNLFIVEVIESSNFSLEKCMLYKNLHILASGRQKREDATYTAMFDMIANGDAHLVLVANTQEVLGTYLFFNTQNSSFYASSATSQKVKNSDGVGHLGVWAGIEYAIKRQFKFVDLALFGLEDETKIDDKNKAINFFKQGFGGKDIINLQYTSEP